MRAGAAAPLLLRRVALAAVLHAACPRRRGQGKGRRPAAGAPLTPQHQMGEQLLRERRLEEALHSFDEAVRADPASHHTRAQRSKTLGLMGRLDEALTELELVLVPEPPDERRWFGNQWFMKGLVLQQLGRKLESVNSMRTGVRLQRESPAPELLVSLCVAMEDSFHSGQIADTTAHLQEALGYCDAAIESAHGAASDDKSAVRLAKTAHLNKGTILFHLNRYDEARVETDAAANLMATHKPLAAEIEAAVAASPQPLPPSHGEMHTVWSIKPGAVAQSPSKAPFQLVRKAGSEGERLHIPIWISRAVGSGKTEMNRRLIELTHARRAEDPIGKTVSNVGGWQSGKSRRAEFTSFLQESSSLAGTAGDGARMLYAHILQEAAKFLAELNISANQGTPYVTMKESWVNVNEKGHRNKVHNHGMCAPTKPEFCARPLMCRLLSQEHLCRMLLHRVGIWRRRWCSGEPSGTQPHEPAIPGTTKRREFGSRQLELGGAWAVGHARDVAWFPEPFGRGAHRGPRAHFPCLQPRADSKAVRMKEK